MTPATFSIAQSADERLLEGVNRLLPQLSASAEPLSLAYLRELIESESVALFIAREEDVIVGMLSLAFYVVPMGRRAWIEDVVVDEASRGRGFAESLTLAALDEARRRGARTVDLTSRPSREAANALYRRLGFQERQTNVYRLSLD